MVQLNFIIYVVRGPLFALKTLNIPAKSGIIAYYFDLSEHIRRARLTFHCAHGKIP